MRENKSLKWMVIIIGFVVVLAVLVIVWQKNINALPVVKIPTPVMPSPNAFDYYVDAGNVIVDEKKIRDATEDMMPSAGSSPRVFTIAEKKTIVDQNARALVTLRQAFRFQCVNPPSRSFDTLFPYLAKWRNLSRLLVLDAQVKEAGGDYWGAMKSSLDAVEFGATSPRGGTIIHDLVGVAVQNTGRQRAWQEVDKLSATEAKRATKRLESIMARQVPFADALLEEKWASTAGLIELLQKPDWFSAFSGSTTGTPTPADVWMNVRVGLCGKRMVIHNFMQFMDESAAMARKPYARRLPGPKPPTDPVNQIIAPIYSRARLAHVNRTDTQNSLLAVALALHAYKLAHGRYPASLNDLAPSYLKRVPSDPFALSGPLRYKLKGTRYVLYSVGPDGKDNGGKPTVDPRQPVDSRYRVMSDDDKGDIVAGLNK